MWRESTAYDWSAKRNVTWMPVQQPYQPWLRGDLPTLKGSIDRLEPKIDQGSMIECPCSIMPQLSVDSNESKYVSTPKDCLNG